MLWLGKNHKQTMPISTLKLVLLLIGLGALAASPLLHPSEAETLKAIAQKMNITTWDFKKDPCSGEGNWGYYNFDSQISSRISCVCKEIRNTSTCRVTAIYLTGQNLSGPIPPELSKLQKLKVLDLKRNCLTGPLPPELATLNLVEFNVLGNKLSGPFPLVLTKISTLEILFIEANNFSGPIPSDISRLINLRILGLSSNGFEGNFPLQVFDLINLEHLAMSDTNFTGQIPDRFHQLKNISRLYIQGTHLEGPIPSTISSSNLTVLRITDLKGNLSSAFPNLSRVKSLRRLILRNCMVTGNIPEYIGNMKKLVHLDLSFNKLSGEIPASFSTLQVRDMYLTGNMLTGPMPQWISFNGILNLDISKNNFTWNADDEIPCLVNAVESYSSAVSNISQVESYMKQGFPCPSEPYYHSVHINCGGNETRGVGEESTYTYDSDSDPRGASMYYSGQGWAFSSTGVFMDSLFAKGAYIKVNSSALMKTNDSYPEELYTTARASPLSLTYYGLCLLNGKYIVKLHFAEIIISNDNNSYTSLGRRVFDVFIQGRLVLKDFDIAREAGGAAIPIVWTFDANVENNTLEIRFYWAGRGTQMIPTRGTYGPLISAISISPDFKLPSHIETWVVITISSVVVGVVLLVAALVVLWAIFFRRTDIPLSGVNGFSFDQIKKATKNFHPGNKLGEGGFGPVYKGVLADGTNIAVKKHSPTSRQGNNEFMKELIILSELDHPNLVKLRGFCLNGNESMLVYEYMENNSLNDALFGESKRTMDWASTKQILIGIAKGLEYLHEGTTREKIVHRDIKTENVLLDGELNPKISDFGLAMLFVDEGGPINTRIIGTIGYMAPEYALRGVVSEKADVFSFGVVAIEVITRKPVVKYNRNTAEGAMEGTCLTDMVHDYAYRQRGDLWDLVDHELKSSGPPFEEVIAVLRLAVRCTHGTPDRRPTMSLVVQALEGDMPHLGGQLERQNSGPSRPAPLEEIRVEEEEEEEE